MDNQYYTPTLEELIEAFINEDTIYSFVNKIENKKIIDVIEKIDYYPMNHQYNKLLSLHMFASDFKSERSYKLKYLDEEDIKDLGFINWTVEWTDPARYYFTKALPDGQESIKKGIQLFFIFGSYDRDHVTIYNLINDIKHILFDGVVKNKSELKKLLKQLNIL